MSKTYFVLLPSLQPISSFAGPCYHYYYRMPANGVSNAWPVSRAACWGSVDPPGYTVCRHHCGDFISLDTRRSNLAPISFPPGNHQNNPNPCVEADIILTSPKSWIVPDIKYLVRKYVYSQNFDHHAGRPFVELQMLTNIASRIVTLHESVVNNPIDSTVLPDREGNINSRISTCDSTGW
jgi:hypothetical protein